MFYKALGYLTWKSFKIAVRVKLHGTPRKRIAAGAAVALAGGVALAVLGRGASGTED